MEELKATIRVLDTHSQLTSKDSTEFVPSASEPTLILIDYLITYMQLVTMFDPQDFHTFAH